MTVDSAMVAAADYRDAMARFASGVTIVTTADESGRWFGFTASSFTALSMDPPLILVCLARTARCHPVFRAAPRFRVNVLGLEHEQLAVRFATSGADKFGGNEFHADPESGLPVLEGALVGLECSTTDITEGGDHTILIARIEAVALRRDGVPAVHADRRFWDLVPRRKDQQ
ncbi:flavin reductase family protein [Nocardia sp. NPDC051030]|uniref:flavin reductase family protein n=1 Tax=Nocardia sp. NPDC051030 TaxID=3155162 RepID=UPI00342C0377